MALNSHHVAAALNSTTDTNRNTGRRESHRQIASTDSNLCSRINAVHFAPPAKILVDAFIIAHELLAHTVWKVVMGAFLHLDYFGHFGRLGLGSSGSD